MTKLKYDMGLNTRKPDFFHVNNKGSVLSMIFEDMFAIVATKTIIIYSHVYNGRGGGGGGGGGG